MSSMAELRSILWYKGGSNVKGHQEGDLLCLDSCLIRHDFVIFFLWWTRSVERILYYSTSLKGFAIRLQRSMWTKIDEKHNNIEKEEMRRWRMVHWRRAEGWQTDFYDVEGGGRWLRSPLRLTFPSSHHNLALPLSILSKLHLPFPVPAKMRLSISISAALLAFTSLVSASNVVDLDTTNFDQVRPSPRQVLTRMR